MDFFRNKLWDGGVFYVSYNTLPGWIGFIPVRNPLTDHAKISSAVGHGIVANIGPSPEFAEKTSVWGETERRPLSAFG